MRGSLFVRDLARSEPRLLGEFGLLMLCICFFEYLGGDRVQRTPEHLPRLISTALRGQPLSFRERYTDSYHL
ncbi:hypothetical protein BDW72DRAFT_177334 [Aspergillus terricola var. indicus]